MQGDDGGIAPQGVVLGGQLDQARHLAAVEATGARRVLVTHGQCDAFARFLRQRGYDAGVLATRYAGERPDADEAGDDDGAAAAPEDDAAPRDAAMEPGESPPEGAAS